MRRATITSIALILVAPLVAQEEPDRVDIAITEKKEAVRQKVDRPGITNHWFGAGPALEDAGIHLIAAGTLFLQDPLAGTNASSSEWSGKFDALLRIDLEKSGLWRGLSLTAHPEYNFGTSANGYGGTLLSINTAMLLPGATDGSRYDTSSLFLTQRFNETFTLIAGKTNLADVAALHPYAGGAGLTGFMNGALASAPNGAIPPYVYGGALLTKTDRAVISLGIYGGESAQGKLDFHRAFDSGYLVSAGVTVPVTPNDLPGIQSVSVIAGDRDASAYSRFRNIALPGAKQQVLDLDTTRFVITYAFHQALAQWENNRNWGVWGRANISDNELTAVAWSAAGGIGGHSPIASREHDRWGVGLFYFSFADVLKTPGILARPVNDEFGAELFYNARITQSLHLTADLQIVEPGVPGQDTAVIAGLRATIRF